MSGKTAKILAELRRGLARLYGKRLVHVILYGSCARGEEAQGSDLDVLVVLRGEVSPCEEIGRSLDEVAAVSLRFDETVSCVFISEEQYEREHSPLLINIRREGISA